MRYYAKYDDYGKLIAIGTGTDVTEALTTFTNNANALG